MQLWKKYSTLSPGIYDDFVEASVYHGHVGDCDKASAKLDETFIQLCAHEYIQKSLDSSHVLVVS